MKSAHQLALWMGVSALLGNLVGLKVLELMSDEDWLQLAAGFVFSVIVGLLAYARERVNEAKHEAERHDIGPSSSPPSERYPQVPGRGSPYDDY